MVINAKGERLGQRGQDVAAKIGRSHGPKSGAKAKGNEGQYVAAEIGRSMADYRDQSEGQKQGVMRE